MKDFLKSFATDVLTDADEFIDGARELLNEAFDLAETKLAEWAVKLNEQADV